MIRFITIIAVFSANLLVAQSFGQNKVQYRNFDWSFITSPHFDIYYYGDAIDLAQYTAEKGEEAYEQISKHLRWTLRKRVPIIIYHSHNDFQQTNVVLPYMQEGIGGVTELYNNRIVIPFDGSLNANGFPKGKVGTKYKVHLPAKYSDTPGTPVDAVVVDIPFKESFNANTREVVKG